MNISDLRYDPFFGQLVWNVKRKGVPYGVIAGRLSESGYRQVCVNYKFLYVHRVIWELHNGPIPDGIEIDHRNGDKDCNYIWNLRLASHSQNMHNLKVQINNTSGVKGVCWNKRDRLWDASVKHRNKRYRKSFKDLDEAIDWLENKRENLHGLFTNHG